MMLLRRAVLIAALVVSSAMLTGAGALAQPAAPAARAAASASAWGTAQQVPGSAALNTSGHAALSSVSCTSAGNCGAGGYYSAGTAANGKPAAQAMVGTETAGSWQDAQELPGTAALNAGGYAVVTSVSCTAPGDCGAGGYYTDAAGNQQAFVGTEAGGSWQSAQEIPGLAALDQGSPGAELLSVSCAAAGECSAGGYYTDAAGRQQAFLVTETGGSWGTAQQVPGTAAVNAGGYAAIASVSCPAAGSCVAGGYYASSAVDGIPVVQALVDTETGGSWQDAQEAPGTAALNAGGYAAISSVSCAAPGYCSAGGEFTNATPATEALVASLNGGTWSPAHEIRGSGVLNKGGLADVTSVSCAAQGQCSAVGYYHNAAFTSEAFVAGRTRGVWGAVEQVPGTAALNQGTSGASAGTVSCGAAGDCSLGGYYTDSAGGKQAFVASEAGGTWSAAQEVPGSGGLNTGGAAATDSVSCPAAGSCSAGGHYTTSAGAQQAFVADKAGS